MEKIFTKDEVETVEWMVLVAELKIKELQENADTEKLILLEKHKNNLSPILEKVIRNG
jgi:hypothetical protein